MKVLKLNALILLLLLIGISSCKNNSNNNDNQNVIQSLDSLVADKLDSATQKGPEKPALKVNYTPLAIRKSDSVKKYFKDHFTPEQKELIYTLNRVDARHVNNPDTLIIPDTFVSDVLAYSPFPMHIPILENISKFVFFSYPIQAFVVYENGKQMRWGPTSMGSKAHPTPQGLHFTNWKSKKAISTVKSTWILPWNFNIANRAGVGWHQYEMPGYPASHSCLRLHEEDAKFLYGFADQWILDKKSNLVAKGTPVIVNGAYPFGERRPWLHLLEDPKANSISKEKMTEFIAPYVSEIIEQQNVREAAIPKEEIKADSTEAKEI